MKKIQLLLLIVLSVFFAQCASTRNKIEEKAAPRVKNVIVMIGDGMGVSQVYAGLTANKGTLFLEKSQFIGFSKTYSASNYVTIRLREVLHRMWNQNGKNGAIGCRTPMEVRLINCLTYAAGKRVVHWGLCELCLSLCYARSFVAHQPSVIGRGRLRSIL